jgi:chromosome partitioning protein
MPVITLASPKGGCGKSTTALVLATTLATRGASVSLLDCDPNQPLVAWATGGSAAPVTVIGGITESQILTVIDVERAERQFVIIDLEGAATRLQSRAIMRSDLVLVPVAPTALDAAQAARAVALVQEEEQAIGRSIPVRICFNRTSPQIATRAERAIVEELRTAGVPVLKAHLNMRAAFASLFAYRCALDELDPALVNGVDKAIENAHAFADEIVALLEEQSRRAAA